MSRSNILFLLVLGSFWGLAGCGSRSGGSSPYLSNEDVIGRWVTEEVQVRVESRNNLPRDSVFAAGLPGQFPVTYLYANGNYRDEVYNEQDSLLSTQAGNWHFNQDTLYLRLEEATSAASRFFVRKKGKRLLLSSQVDWDGDGKKDDRIEVALKKD